MRAAGISFLSLALTTAVIGNAYYQKKQFYPSVVYITKSNPSMAVIYIQALVIVILAGKLMRKVFFGQLRAAEFEHLADRSWYAVTETCLAFTVFRDDFSPKFVALFTVLFFLKSFHWLAEDRVDFMERSPVISWLFHLRVVSLMTCLSMLDAYFVGLAYQSTVSKGASVQLVFGFEYMILLTIVFNITIKYVLHTIDLHSENPWDNKAVFLLYTEVVMGLMKVILYATFVVIMVRIYTLPLFAFRPMYYTMRSFKKAVNDVILSRRAIRNMNTLYLDATPEELAAADNVCIICREEMVTASKKLPCNHIFHTSCLRSWFQRQQTCPTCRLNILRIPGENNNPANQPAGAPAPPAHVPDAPAPAHAAHPGLANPFANGMFPAMFPLWQQHFNLQQQNQQQPQAQQNQTPQPGLDPSASRQQQQTSTTSTGTTEGPTGLPSFPPLPIFCPPFPPFQPYSIPPPIPPPGLTMLSDEELRRLESASREGVTARLQCLRNIQLLLDAAVVMMQQYSTAAATAAAVPVPGTSENASSTNEDGKQPPVSSGASTSSAPSSSATASAIPVPGTSETTSASDEVNKQSSASSGAGASATTASTANSTNTPKPNINRSTSFLSTTQVPSTTSERTDEPAAAGSSKVSSSTLDTNNSNTQCSEQEEIRRRRLQKFLTDSEAAD